MTLIGLAVYRFANQNKWLEDDYISQNELSRQNTLFEDLFLFIQTAESSVRGYAGTGNKEFIRDFKSTIDSIRINYRELKDFKPHKADAANNQLISSFDKLIAQKIEFMLQVKNLCDIGKRNEALSMIATERGIELTDSILKINEATKTALRGSLEESKNIFTRINKRTNNIAYLSITTSIILIIIVVYFLLTEIRKTRVISDQLELQKEHLRTTLFSIGEGLITTGNDGRIIYMNPAAERLTGWTNAEAKNKPLQDIYNVVNEESGKRIEHVVSRILKERKVVELENNTLLHTKNAGTLIISNNGSPILDTKGNILGAVLVFNDITEKKKTETELKESENQYRRLIENLPVAVFTCNKSGVINLYNKAIVELWGKKPVAGKEVWYDSLKLFNKDGNRIPDNENPMAFTLKDEKAYHGDEIIVQRPDGSVRHILPYPTPVFDAQGRLAGGVSVHIDLTEKKRAEEKIRKAVERYDILARATSDCIWDWDIENDSILYNDSMGNMFGYTRNDIKNGTAWWKSNIHPDDIALVSARLDEVFTKQIETTQLEYRYRCADNSYKYILDRSFVVYDENNKPVRMIGSMQDITSEKEQEKE
ncbi:MAG: PAS domain S-box protein, partial [Ferruginibacter sp.]